MHASYIHALGRTIIHHKKYFTVHIHTYICTCIVYSVVHTFPRTPICTYLQQVRYDYSWVCNLAACLTFSRAFYFSRNEKHELRLQRKSPRYRCLYLSGTASQMTLCCGC